MPAQVAIIHGWSDSSESFHPLRDFLVANGFAATDIWLADYLSMEDDVRVEDVAKRMQAVLLGLVEAGKLTKPFDLIVHSTGGLVAREWIDLLRRRGEACPAKRVVMLAPANFGSSLAHLGKSMIGRIAKGWDNWFQTGTEMLRGLELASPYQWDLACRDLLDPSTEGPSAGPYSTDGVWPFVIVGSRGYPSGLRQIVNENGSDGTVRAAAANLNAVGMTIDFSGDPQNPIPRIWGRRCGPIPFAVLPDRNHSTITRPAENPGSQVATANRLGQLIIRALRCDTAQTYATIAQEWSVIADATADLADNPPSLPGMFQKDRPQAAAYHQYFHVITRVVDDDRRPVDDYYLEFFPPQEQGDDAAVYFLKNVLEDVHVNEQAKSYRALYADRYDLMKGFYPKLPPGQREVAMSISAANVGPHVHYFDSRDVGAKGHVLVHQEEHDQRRALGARLFRNTTHLVEIVIPRMAVDDVYKLAQ